MDLSNSLDDWKEVAAIIEPAGGDEGAVLEGQSIEDSEQQIKDKAHEARLAYEAEKGLYEAFAKSVEDVIRGCLDLSNVMVHEVTSRAKEPRSFERKAAQPSRDNPAESRYSNPLVQITDKAAIRIITYFLSTVDSVCATIEQQFDVTEKDKRINSDPNRLGYQSIHYLVKYSKARYELPEYNRYAGLVAEIQVRTILQHAWAEIEHDIQYKAVSILPSQIRRRFASLAGLIEIADREFQAIENDNRDLREEAKRNVARGELDKVEITGDSLKAYLDQKFGRDGRMADWNYSWTARVLIALGFTSLAQVDECIKGRDDKRISRIIYGGKRGQITRFEEVLLASMGENYIFAHPWLEDKELPWFVSLRMDRLEKLRSAGISIGNYQPPGYPGSALRSKALYLRAQGTAEEKEADSSSQS